MSLVALLACLQTARPAAPEPAALAVKEFPARWTAWARPDASLALDEEPAARAAFEKALALLPGDPRLARALESLAGD